MKRFLIGILLTTLLCSAYADDTVSIYPQQGVIPFKGLDDTSSPISIIDGRATALQNVKLSRSLTLRKRDGYSLINGVMNRLIGAEYFPAVTGVHYAKLSSGTAYRVAITGDRFYSDESSAWTVKGSPAITYSANNQFDWETALDNIIFTNDVDVPMKWTGSGSVGVLDVSDLTDALTKVKNITWFRNYLILTNTVEATTERPTRFRWSDVGTIETYQDDNFIDIAALGGQEIEAVKELYGDIYLFLTDSIWKASLVGGNDIFVISKVIDDVGCVAKNSVQTINLLNQKQGIVFLSKDKKVHFFDGANIIDISAGIKTVMGNLKATRLQYAVSAVDGSDYYLAVTDGSGAATNNLLLDYQYEIGEWTKHIQIDANAITSVVDSDSIARIWYGNYDSFVYNMIDSTVDNDVSGQTGGVTSINALYDFTNSTATGLTMVITDVAPTGTATGAIVTITSGTAEGAEKVVVDQTATALIVDSTFSTDPDSDSLFSLGAIEANYKTKWFDLGQPALNKRMAQVYLWAETSSGTTISAKEAVDFEADIRTETVDLQGVGGLWGTGLWGDAVWGGESAVFEVIKLSDEGRFLRLTFEDNDIDQDFNLYGYSVLFWNQDLQ